MERFLTARTPSGSGHATNIALCKKTGGREVCEASGTAGADLAVRNVGPVVEPT